MMYGHLKLPPGWAWIKLKFVASYNDDTLSESTDPDSEFRYIEISDVSLSGGIAGTTRMTFAAAPSRARRVVRQGDILVSTVRTYLKAIARVDEDADDLIASTGFCVVRPSDIHPGYLGWVLKSDLFVDEVVSQSVGVSYPAISAATLMDIKVPVAPPSVQARIDAFLQDRADRIDRVAGRSPPRDRSDALSQLHRAIADYRASLIFHAVSGQIEALRCP